MTYLVAADLPTAPAGERFRALLPGPASCRCPARITAWPRCRPRLRGSTRLYLSGAAMTASMGMPDLGMITVDEVCFFVRQIARATGLPLLVDGDTGYGEALNVMHMVRCFEDAGAAAVHIEDQLLPKKCGHLNDKKLADAARHGGKDRRRPPRAPASVHRRPHRRRRQRGHGRRGGARETVSGRRRRRDLPRGADHRRDVPHVRPPRRCTAARQHDRVRPHPVLHRQPSSRRWATRW